jgi:hypothetical protein
MEEKRNSVISSKARLNAALHSTVPRCPFLFNLCGIISAARCILMTYLGILSGVFDFLNFDSRKEQLELATVRSSINS